MSAGGNFAREAVHGTCTDGQQNSAAPWFTACACACLRKPNGANGFAFAVLAHFVMGE